MLAEFQNALVTLAVDRRLRQAFAVDATAVLAQFDLDDRERGSLLALPSIELERFAQGLIAKRWDDLAPVVPLTLRIAPKVASYYREWLAEHPALVSATLLPAGIAEALRCEAIVRQRLVDDDEPGYAADLWSFEIRRAAARRDGEVRTLTSRYAIESIAREVAGGLLPIDPPRQATEVRFASAKVTWRRC